MSRWLTGGRAALLLAACAALCSWLAACDENLEELRARAGRMDASVAPRIDGGANDASVDAGAE